MKSQQRERYEKDNAATLVEEADRIKMESEQEKADLQVCLGLLSFLLTTLTSVLYPSYKPILIMNLYPIGSKLLGVGGGGGGQPRGVRTPQHFACLLR